MSSTRTEAGVEVLVVGPSRSGGGGVNRYIAEQRRHLPDHVRTRVYSVAVPPGDGLARFALAVLVALRQMLPFPFRRPPDVVHVHTSHWHSFYQSSWYVFVAAFVWRRPVVLHVHGSSFDEFLETDSRLVRALQNAVFDASDVVVALSDGWAELIERRVDSRKVTVLHNAVDVAEYESSFSTSPIRLSFVSNHVERKGVEELVAAIDRLAEERPVDVVIAGKGPESNLAADLADERPGVEYVGFVSEERKREILAESSVYVLPTYAEGVPIAILEAMTAGNAIVSTAVGGIPSVVDDRNGVLVEPGDADALADALRTLLGDPDRVESMARASSRRAERSHSWDRVTEELVALYYSLAGTPPSDAESPPSDSEPSTTRSEA
ncbi:glycosyltransferase family 4 protein [Halorubrum rubrum]|uniref:Glycosyltransferase family 4 protein n=1 Tax=Halorubrum rubrum TaxID=1126240 RepID=A0ABD5QZ18_9EURY|nr:glycosyltransferase family 4 protein [Halorubrum rubrum]